MNIKRIKSFYWQNENTIDTIVFLMVLFWLIGWEIHWGNYAGLW